MEIQFTLSEIERNQDRQLNRRHLKNAAVVSFIGISILLGSSYELIRCFLNSSIDFHQDRNEKIGFSVGIGSGIFILTQGVMSLIVSINKHLERHSEDQKVK